MKRKLIILFSIPIMVLSCSKSSDNSGSGGGSSTNNCSGVANKFAADVNPIIQTKCATNAGCHGSGSTSGPGPLLTYTQISNAKTAIKTAVNNGTMPQTGSLTTAQKNSIICWVDAGGLNN